MEKSMEERLHEICCLQMHIGRLRHRIIDSRIRKLGIHPGQHFVLAQLKRAGQLPSQARLAEEMDVSPALIARTLKQLESGGYIRRGDCASDGRRNEILITEKGERILREGMEIFREVDGRSFADFSGGEIDQLHALLAKQRGNLVPMEQKEMKEI